MPKTKEEMYALIHEFDDRVDSMINCIDDFISSTNEENLSTLDWALLTVYRDNLWDLVSAYCTIDHALSRK